MNLFAESPGGISSGLIFAEFGFRDRAWAQYLELFFVVIILFGSGLMDNTQAWRAALIAWLFFPLSLQMSEGKCCGIAPFMKKRQLVVMSEHIMGAGGRSDLHDLRV